MIYTPSKTNMGLILILLDVNKSPKFSDPWLLHFQVGVERTHLTELNK